MRNNELVAMSQQERRDSIDTESKCGSCRKGKIFC